MGEKRQRIVAIYKFLSFLCLYSHCLYTICDNQKKKKKKDYPEDQNKSVLPVDGFAGCKFKQPKNLQHSKNR